MPALYQDDDDGNDLSDLLPSTGKKNNADNGEDEQFHHQSEHDDESAVDQEEDVFRGAEKPVVAASVKVATVTTTAIADRPVAAENGYDRAIKDYVDFAESKRTSVAKCEEQQQQQQQPKQQPRKPLAEAKRRMSAPKIEEKVMLLKTWSQSTKDLNAGTAELPKVDIGKRREIFEKICSETKAEVQQTAASKKKSPSVAVGANTPSPVQAAAAAAVVCTAGRPHAIEEISTPETPVTGKIHFFVRTGPYNIII